MLSPLKAAVSLLVTFLAVLGSGRSEPGICGFRSANYTADGRGMGHLTCRSQCNATLDPDAPPPLTEWTIERGQKRAAFICLGITLRSDGSSNFTVRVYDAANKVFNVWPCLADPTATDSCLNYCDALATPSNIYVDNTTGALYATQLMWRGLSGSSAHCRILHPSCSYEKKFIFSVDSVGQHKMARLKSLKSSPSFRTNESKDRVRLSWPYGSTQPRLICLSADLFNRPSVVASHNGSVLPVSALEGEGQPCTDCTSPACLGRARRSVAAAGQLNSSLSGQPLGRARRSAEAAIAGQRVEAGRVYQVQWLKEECGDGKIKHSALILIYFDDAPFVNYSHAGTWEIDFPKVYDPKSVIYTVDVAVNLTTSFVHAPNGSYGVAEGGNLNLFCVIATPFGRPAPNSSTMHWVDPNGQIVPTADVTVDDDVSSEMFPPPSSGGGGGGDLTCSKLAHRHSVFVSRRSHAAYGVHGAFLRHTLVLHVCEAGPQDQGAYYCRLDGLLEARTHLKVHGSSGLSEKNALLLGLGLVAVAVLCCVLAAVLPCTYRHGRRADHAGRICRKKGIESTTGTSTSGRSDDLVLGPNILSLAGLFFAEPLEPLQLYSGDEEEEEEAEAAVVDGRGDMWEFPRQQLQPLEVIGEGNFGRVLKAKAEGIVPQWPEVNIVAVKVVKGNPPRPCDLDDLLSELQLMKSIKPHPNIINLLGHCTRPDGPLCIIMEYAAVGSLKGLLGECRRLLERTHNWDSSLLLGDQPCPDAELYLAEYVLGVNSATGSSIGGGGGGDGGGGDRRECSENGRHPRSSCTHSSRHSTTSPSSASADSGYRRSSVLSAARSSSRTLGGGGTAYVSTGGSSCVGSDSSGYSSGYVNSSSSSSSSSYVNSSSSCSGGGGSAGSRSESAGRCRTEVSSGHPVKESSPPSRTGSPTSSKTGSSISSKTGSSISSKTGSSVSSKPTLSNQSSSGYGSYRANLSSMSEGESSDPTDPVGGVEGGGVSSSLLKDVDVFNIALQVARGMAHLESVKCVHRDLAARNVLITDNFTIKVCDFGLARDTGESDYYRARTLRPLPTRWMAVETLLSGVHTSKSDVWSFGVLLWEVLTYGDVPYRTNGVGFGMNTLTTFLASGGRMLRPRLCSDPMYYLMMKCWESCPDSRPSFSDLEQVFDRTLTLCEDHYKAINSTVADGRSESNSVLNPATSTSGGRGDGETSTGGTANQTTDSSRHHCLQTCNSNTSCLSPRHNNMAGRRVAAVDSRSKKQEGPWESVGMATEYLKPVVAKSSQVDQASPYLQPVQSHPHPREFPRGSPSEGPGVLTTAV